MFKKMILGTLFAGLIVILVIGGIVRTRAKLDQAAETAVSNSTTTGHENHEDHEQQRTAVSEWQTVSATVTNVRNQGLWLQLQTGSTVRIRKQPWAFAQSQGFTAQIGDVVTLTGYTDGAEFEICVIENPAAGQMAQLRDENGRSLWNVHDES